MAVRKIKLIVQYDGSAYSGWQVQPGKRTIQGELVEAVSNLTGRRTFVHGASRTDAGVSALGQVALFEIESPIPTENFAEAINDRLPKNIVVTEATEAPRGFDLISGPTSKLYRYTIYAARRRPVLDLNRCWHLPMKLDTQAMQQAADLLIGRKDFKSFASGKDKREITVRTIFRCEVVAEDKWIYIDVEGDGFLYNMVRNIVGTLVEVGTGRWKPEKITEIIEAKDRTAAGRLAPPNGLCLMWIKY
ncbi:MAG: tRNA pseudouridine(38-40) synthase TruA [Sedimentisphaerales bacterium]|nr:tRNA pseudouridine(38-40) synthase TruA [Sedimentisphaerales bacterium]